MVFMPSLPGSPDPIHPTLPQGNNSEFRPSEPSSAKISLENIFEFSSLRDDRNSLHDETGNQFVHEGNGFATNRELIRPNREFAF
jgi:hypothetical protein